MAFVAWLLIFWWDVSAMYTTNFSSFDSDNWSLSTDCEHCSHENGQECTQYEKNAATFGSVSGGAGVTITTSVLPKKSSCGGLCESAHLTFKQYTKYGKIIVKSRWFPGNDKNVSTGEGYIDWDGDPNTNAITFGFDGGNHNGYKTVCYASNSGHQVKQIDAAINIANNFETYQIEWTKDKIIWTMNGNVVRTETDTKYIPSTNLIFRLHSRSSNCPAMPKDATLFSQHLSFTYYNESELTY
eukprot:475417_1